MDNDQKPNDFTESELLVTHNVLRRLKGMFEGAAKEGVVPEEAKTLDDAMWYVEEQMTESMQEAYSEQ